jgi:hypothetical protein
MGANSIRATTVTSVMVALLATVLVTHCAKNKGDCVPECTSGLVCCDGFCVNLQSDPDHCGSCENACQPGARCLAGSCTEMCGGVECPAGQSCCDDVCTDLDTSQNHCGGCGNACAAGEACIEGTCTLVDCDPPCGAGETCCPVVGSDPVCANLSVDDDNCGGCGHACPADQSCSTGICTSEPCDPPDCGGDPMRCCGGDCVNTDTDLMHCGFCGHACDTEEADACSGGICQCNSAPACHTGQKCCTGVGCRNISSDVNNCGDCDVVCDPGLTCNDGICNCGGETCLEGYGCCTGECRDLRYDATNCGACGHSCGSNGPACDMGECVCGPDPACDLSLCTMVGCSELEPPGPYDICPLCCPFAGGCVPNSDENCGSCGNACTGGTRCEPVGVTCTFACVPPTTDASTDGDV